VASRLAQILRTMLLSLLVITCMGVGWFLVNGRRPARAAGVQLAAAGPKKDENKADADPAVVPKEKEQPPAKAKEQEKKGERDKGKEKDPPPTKTNEPPANGLTFEKDVRPILERSCVSCHGAKKRGGLDLRTYQALFEGGDGGTGVVPGNPDKSPLYETVASGRCRRGRNCRPRSARRSGRGSLPGRRATNSPLASWGRAVILSAASSPISHPPHPNSARVPSRPSPG